MSVHTPGPWEADGAKDGENHYYQIDGPTPKGLDPKWPYTVADTLNRHHCISPEEDAANAHLIAAAPVLLKSLEGLLEYLRVFWPLEPLFSTFDDRQAVEIADAEAAIRKAREGR